MRKIALVTAFLAVTAVAEAATVGGVDISDKTTVGGQTLVLNGAGLRKKFFIKVYTGALYLPSKQTS
ncbi:MAG: chalcone isomerase family protein, partial [Thermoanaerobaculia bacterium]|nr:chalcone isomerase family protein [Thermoanaerobaculia bacterium]